MRGNFGIKSLNNSSNSILYIMIICILIKSTKYGRTLWNLENECTVD